MSSRHPRAPPPAHLPGRAGHGAELLREVRVAGKVGPQDGHPLPQPKAQQLQAVRGVQVKRRAEAGSSGALSVGVSRSASPARCPSQPRITQDAFSIGCPAAESAREAHAYSAGWKRHALVDPTHNLPCAAHGSICRARGRRGRRAPPAR